MSGCGTYPSRPKLDEYLVVRVATGQGRLHDYDLECLHREGKRDLGEPAAFLEALQVEVQSVHLALHDVAGIKHGMTSVDEVVIEGRHHQLLVRHNPTQDRAVESVVLVLGLGVGYCGQAIKGGLATEHLDVVGRHWGQRVALFTQAAWALRRARPLGQRAGTPKNVAGATTTAAALKGLLPGRPQRVWRGACTVSAAEHPWRQAPSDAHEPRGVCGRGRRGRRGGAGAGLHVTHTCGAVHEHSMTATR
eukprot:scaffold276_cov548-Prasinococcus_capsulatus_cf.AAC.12